MHNTFGNRRDYISFPSLWVSFVLVTLQNLKETQGPRNGFYQCMTPKVALVRVNLNSSHSSFSEYSLP